MVKLQQLPDWALGNAQITVNGREHFPFNNQALALSEARKIAAQSHSKLVVLDSAGRVLCEEHVKS